MKLPRHQLNQQSGVIALFITVVLGILLFITTISITQLNVSELNQSTQVDRSDQSYYAAEAGIEEASQRIDANPQIQDMKKLFPEQYDVTQQLVGDCAALLDGNNNFISPINIEDEASSPTDCQTDPLSWRQRKVYDASVAPEGQLLKDESVQLDTTALERKCPAGGTADVPGGTAPDIASPNDCDNNPANPLMSHFTNMMFCWTPTVPGAPLPDNVTQLELTALSYDGTNINTVAPVTTKKVIVPTSGGALPYASPGIGETLSTTGGIFFGGPSGYDQCLNFGVNTSQRYIFRIRPLFTSAGATRPQSQYLINYKVFLIDSSAFYDPANSGTWLFIPNDSVLIDVIGQSGEIRRRIVARKFRNGRLLGIFDFVLYSGDKVVPLCKAGVQQSDVTYNCQVVPSTATGTSN